MKKGILRNVSLSKGLKILVFMSLAAFSVLTAKAQSGALLDNTKELFKQVQIFADAISLISVDYVKPVDVKDLVYGAIKGMMNTLDGYSQFLDQESYQDIKEETKGEFGGIGIEIGIREGILTVITPIEDTPAHAAGVEAGDKIVKIDDDVTRDMALNDAVKKLRGEPGSEVTITVMREQVDKLLDFKMKRALIKLKSIKEARIIYGDIAYVKLVEFQERTARDFRKAMKDLVKEGAVDLVLDLRNNPGGLLDASVEVADQFLPAGMLIVYTEGRNPDEKLEFYSRKKPDYEGMDVVVLVNKGSASAGEILAGALQDNKRALLVGTTTFGKGSVQTVIPLKDKSALRLTTAAYYTPSGRNLMDKGIDPDIHVENRVFPGDIPEHGDEESKSRLFDKVEGKETKNPRDGKIENGAAADGVLSGENTEDKDDEQLQAAVNILKGVRIFESNKMRDI
jgi:carboxyl-terminal processing protease